MIKEKIFNINCHHCKRGHEEFVKNLIECWIKAVPVINIRIFFNNDDEEKASLASYIVKSPRYDFILRIDAYKYILLAQHGRPLLELEIDDLKSVTVKTLFNHLIFSVSYLSGFAKFTKLTQKWKKSDEIYDRRESSCVNCIFFNDCNFDKSEPEDTVCFRWEKEFPNINYFKKGEEGEKDE